MLSWQVSLTVFFVSKAMMSLKTSLAGAATAIGLTALAYPAQSAQFSFTYTHGGPTTPIVLSGILTGTATGNIIEIDGFSNLVYNGVALPFSTLTGGMVEPYPTVPTNPNDPDYLPIQASFDGSVMNFMLYDETGTDYVGFLATPNGVKSFTSSITQVAVLNDLGGAEEPFDPSKMMWEAALIPEPGAVVGLLGLGLGALASKVIKKG
jgi:hypothetical protein